ncbi:flavodoxin [Agathobaculum sp. Marseille-P7918]|uniref:flavodoxin n=1 Tax=Agathobaculum sp. Marseille-P7918 TaxID=2479843 RepID=UPI00356A7B7E
MKKLFSVLVAMTMAFSLAACSGGNPSSGGDDGFDSSSESSASSEASASDAPSSQPEEGAEEGGTLVAYFSWSGNTQQMAEIIAQETGADLFEIATATPYTDDYNELLDIAQQKQGEDARPELNAQVENWDSYDTIFVGYPNWWSDAPMAVYTFLESYDFTGKTLIPFNTSASGGFGRSLTGIEESAVGATILEGLDLTEGELGDAQNRVTTWLDSLGLNG